MSLFVANRSSLSAGNPLSSFGRAVRPKFCQPPSPSDRSPATFVGLGEEPIHEELELDVPQAVLAEQRRDVGERAGLEHVLEVGVPEPDAAEADALRLCTAIGEVEEAPLAAGVHVHRAGCCPVENDQVAVVGAHLGRR